MYREANKRQGLERNFIYLVQGQANLVRNYLHLSERRNADAVFLTYDEPIKGAIYFPNSTWSQGRNKLLESALERGEFAYYIFLDDDVKFETGGWDEFEQHLLAYRPAVAVPVFPKTKRSPLNLYRINRRMRFLKWFGLRCQTLLLNDEQMIAYHKDVVKDGIILPYQERFDSIHWWASSEIQEILIQNFYRFSAIQFNHIRITNECHNRYSKKHEGDYGFKLQVRKWMAKQFNRGYRDITYGRRYYTPICHAIRAAITIYRTFVFAILRRLGRAGHSVGEKRLIKLLSSDSDLFTQHSGQASVL